MGTLRNLITLKSNGQSQVEETIQESKQEDKQTYHDNGYSSAINANGNSVIFNRCLDDIYEKFKEKCREDEKEQQRLNAPYVAEQERQKTELKKRETLQSIKEDELKEIDNSIIQIDNDISNVRNNPEKYGVEATKKPKAQFYIGLVILLPITLYLLVFYMSASYSAFFKQFETTNLIESIFDGQSLSKAYYDPNGGLLEAIFVCTIPFAFMGLGYLVHMFQKDKRTGIFKIAAMFAVTFIFDSILAYQIESKIYELTKTLSDPAFDLKIAFTKVEFWGIIFAGFVVYIIWGLVFDFVMKEHDNIDKIKLFINKLKEDKQNLLNRKSEITGFINELKQEIAKIIRQIAELQSKIDGFIFPNRKYLLYHAEYVKGWYMAIAAEIALPHDKKKSLIEECEKVAYSHLEKNEVNTHDAENVIYNKNLKN